MSEKKIHIKTDSPVVIVYQFGYEFDGKIGVT